MLLCTKHHALLHEGGFTIEKDYRDRWFFRRPDGRAVPACGYRLEDVTDEDVGTADEYFGGGASAEAPRYSATSCHASAEAARSSTERFTVNEPSAEAWTVREPPTYERMLLSSMSGNRKVVVMGGLEPPTYGL